MDIFSGSDLTLFLQNISVLIILPMQILSLLGQAEMYFLLIPPIYWCYDTRLGIRLSLILGFSGWFNDILKHFFHLPRPYWLTEKIRMLDLHESLTFGFPSGHSQIPVSFLGMTGFWIGKKKLWIAIIFLLLGIGISRVCLGVHFFFDVLGGWMLGILTVLAAILLDKPVTALTRKMSDLICIGVGICISLGITGLSILVKEMNSHFHFPFIWSGIVPSSVVAESVFSYNNAFLTAGFFFGSILGAVLIRRGPGFSTQGSIFRHLQKYFFGMTGLGVIFLGLNLLSHMTGDLLSVCLIWIQGMLLGVWIIYGAPWLFIKLKIMSDQK